MRVKCSAPSVSYTCHVARYRYSSLLCQMPPIGAVLYLRISQSSRILRSHTQHVAQRGRRRTSSQQDRGCIVLGVLANISKFEDSQIAYAACRSGDRDVEPFFCRSHFYSSAWVHDAPKRDAATCSTKLVRLSHPWAKLRTWHICTDEWIILNSNLSW